MTDRLLTPEDVAQQCGLSRKAIYRAIERGELRAARLCSRLRVRPEDVEAWVDAHVLAPPASVPRARVVASPVANGLRTLLTD